ncbi:bcl-2-related ovarian killer protein homolog A isoform X1 [Halyomorpha halys]|uniref:bcl-2-related ovarian killer protein homolog A isoform X1 n=1 Tax=Halyomorpha halys TaxID=286706 RepID=UPI0006D4E48D|nr:bcl-2-related ovarian killer protein homolog A isoform X1 [Halyomorpha halys]XP_014280046.1 bcl-2-related ovarian killer protein homolog A isoform X1 [Halyomorpha halys]
MSGRKGSVTTFTLQPPPPHRRFSHTVSRKLSHSLGWGSSSEERGEIVSVGRSLCWQYMRSRLKRSGLFTKKRGLQRLRSSLSLGHGSVVPRVLPALLALGVELERLRPDVYTGVSRQVGNEPGMALRAVGKQLFMIGMSWPRLVSLFAVAGGLACDTVRAGHPEQMTQIADAMADLVDEELASWIADNGGWMGLCQYWKPINEEPPLGHYVGLLAALLLSLFLIAVAARVIASL